MAGEVPRLLLQRPPLAALRQDSSGSGSAAWDGECGSDGSAGSFLSSSSGSNAAGGFEGCGPGGSGAACQAAAAQLVVVGCQLDGQRLLQLLSGCCTGRVLVNGC
jgi:hypothetical protein